MKFFLLIIVLIVPFYSWCINYYCDPINGSMANSGTQAAPWASLEAVFNQGITFNGGDKIILLNGNHGFPKITGVNNANVEIIAHTGHSPIIERIRIGNTAHAAFWLLNGLTIESENTSQYPINLIDLYSNTNDITVINCSITSNSLTTNWTRNDWRMKANNGIFSRGTNHKFNYNTIENIAIGLTMSSSNSQFIGNTIQYFTIDGVRGLGDDCSYIGNSILDNISVYYYNENHYDGFQSYSCCPVGSAIVNNVIIKQNTIINCTDTTRQFRGSMQGIGCFDGMYNNWIIENNVVIVDNWHGITLTGATNCRIVNNTVIDPYDNTYQDPNDPQQFGNVGPAWIKITAHKTDGGIYSGAPSTNNTIINNLVPTMANDQNIGMVSNNILLGASSNYSNFFVNYNTYDLHLIPTASAIDFGTSVGAPAVDIEGTNRPQGNGIDVGAYEYSGCNPNFSIIPSNNTTICLGDVISLTTDASVVAVWDSGVIDNVSFTPSSTQTYTATVGTGNCVGTEQITIIVDSVPKFTPSVDKASVCQGESITLTTDATVTAIWDYGVIDNVAFVPPHPQTYTATVTNGNCSRSEQIAINVSAIPSLSITSSSSSVCQGDNVTLNAMTDGMNLIWNNGVQNSTPFTPVSTQFYSATANNFGCVISDSILIEVNGFPVLSLTVWDSVLCEGESTLLNATTSVGVISWNNGLQNNIPFTPTQTQTYVATGNNSGCVSTDSIEIVVNPNPVITITQNGNQLAISPSTGFIQWFMNGTTISGATDSIYTINVDGNYSASLIDDNGCQGTSNILTIQGTGVESLINNTVSLYPNPTNEVVNIKSSERIENIKLFNASGALVAEYHQLQAKTIQLPKQTEGVYYVLINTQKKTTYQKIIFTR